LSSWLAACGMSADIKQIAVELARRDDFVVFAGTGVSVEAGLPTWEELLQALERACYGQSKDKFDNPDEFPQKAQTFYDYLVKEGREAEYEAILKEQLEPRKALHTSQEREIVETTGRIVTTNFDRTFEDAIRRVSPNREDFVQQLPSFDVRRMREEYVLTYLHGSSDDCVILKTSDYDMFYPSVSHAAGSRVLEEHLKYLYLNHTLVFIGFSFSDRYLKEALRIIHSGIADEDRIHASVSSRCQPRLEGVKHYAFLQKYDVAREKERLRRDQPEGTQGHKERLSRIEAMSEEEAELDRFLETLHIKVGRYEKHVDWITCFRTIQCLRPERSDTGVILAGNR